LTAAADASPDPSAGVDESRPAPRARWAVALGALVAFGFRLAHARVAVGPIVVADEAAYLAMARSIAGVGTPWDLRGAAGYGVGYSLLIAPLFRLVEDPVTLFRSIAVLNAVLGGLLVVALDALARRLTGLRRPATAAVATVAGCLPTLLVATNRAWSDAAAPLLLALLLLAVLRALDRPTAGRIATLVAVQLAAALVHNRFLPLVAVTVAVVGLAVAGRRASWPHLAAATVALGVGVIAIRLVTGLVHHDLYGGRDGAVKVEAAGRALRVGPLLLSGTGQLWYLLASTAGLAGLGALVLARRGASAAWRSASIGLGRLDGPDRTDAPDRAEPAEPDRDDADAGADDDTAPQPGPGHDSRSRSSRWADAAAALASPAGRAAVVVAYLLVAFAVSVVFMTDRPASQHLVYGRYNDAIVGPLVVVGLGALAGATSRRRLVAGLAATAAVLAATGLALDRARPQLLARPFSPVGVMGIVAIDPAGPQRVLRITLVAAALAAGAALVALLPRRRVLVAAPLAALLVVVGTGRAMRAVDWSAGDRPATIADAPLEDGDEVRVDVGDGTQQQLALRYPFFDDGVTFRKIRSEPFERGFELVLSHRPTPETSRYGYRAIWYDPASANLLWLAPGERQERARAAGRLLPEDLTAPAPGDDRAALDGSLTLDGRRLAGDLTVRRTGEAPWPGAVDGTVRLRGRVRLLVRVDDACGCAPADPHVDLGRYVEAGETSLRVPVDLALGATPTGPVAVTVQLVRVGGEPFGRPLRLTVG